MSACFLLGVLPSNFIEHNPILRDILSLCILIYHWFWPIAFHTTHPIFRPFYSIELCAFRLSGFFFTASSRFQCKFKRQKKKTSAQNNKCAAQNFIIKGVSLLFFVCANVPLFIGSLVKIVFEQKKTFSFFIWFGVKFRIGSCHCDST